MTKKLIEITSEIVQAQASLSAMSTADIASSLRQVFSTLMEIQKAEAGEIALPEIQESMSAEETALKGLTPRDSIQENKVICLECGAEMRQLTSKHLVAHGISQREYKKKYGFSMRTPLSAKSLTKARSKAAKKRGLPENLLKAIEAKRQSKAKAMASAESSAPAVAEGKKTVVRRRRKTA